VIHHDFFNSFKEFDDIDLTHVINDPVVVQVVDVIRRAESRLDRFNAINQLMGRIE
jgi:hypothetical protein